MHSYFSDDRRESQNKQDCNDLVRHESLLRNVRYASACRGRSKMTLSLDASIVGLFRIFESRQAKEIVI